MKEVLILCAGEAPEFVTRQVGPKISWLESQTFGMDVSLKLVNIREQSAMTGSEGSVWIISGSEDSVTQPKPWMKNLVQSIQNGIAAGKPILGICFGHQILADMLGGTVVQNPKGWEIGSADIQLNKNGNRDSLFQGVDTSFIGYETHEDIVTRLPDSCTLLAENEMGIQAFRFAGNVYGVQFHPEFSQSVMKRYVQYRVKQGFLCEACEVKASTSGQMVLRNFLNML